MQVLPVHTVYQERDEQRRMKESRSGGRSADPVGATSPYDGAVPRRVSRMGGCMRGTSWITASRSWYFSASTVKRALSFGDVLGTGPARPSLSFSTGFPIGTFPIRKADLRLEPGNGPNISETTSIMATVTSHHAESMPDKRSAPGFRTQRYYYYYCKHYAAHGTYSPLKLPGPTTLCHAAGVSQALPSSTEVCIVGAGPSGLACALELAARNIPFVIVDALEGGHNGSRVVVMQASAFESKSAKIFVENRTNLGTRRMGDTPHPTYSSPSASASYPSPFVVALPPNSCRIIPAFDAVLSAVLIARAAVDDHNSLAGHRVARTVEVEGFRAERAGFQPAERRLRDEQAEMLREVESISAQWRIEKDGFRPAPHTEGRTAGTAIRLSGGRDAAWTREVAALAAVRLQLRPAAHREGDIGGGAGGLSGSRATRNSTYSENGTLSTPNYSTPSKQSRKRRRIQQIPAESGTGDVVIKSEPKSVKVKTEAASDPIRLLVTPQKVLGRRKRLRSKWKNRTRCSANYRLGKAAFSNRAHSK
ncbi:hypothetical protein B0H11DRAFT_1907762 [Mycena galericulata]|nr:hypothetical protein B0H11DRAFT_1907762 [Mycena galericulata]